MRLTELAIKKLPLPKQGQKTYFDDSLGGFGIRCSQKSKSYVVMYGSQRRLKTLGRAADIGLAEARRRARRILAAHSPRVTLTAYRDAQDVFIEDCKRRIRPRTIEQYQRYLRAFDTKKNVADITRRDIQNHLERYRDTPSTYSHSLVSLKVFFNWAVRNDLADKNPLAGEKLPSVPSRDRVLTTEELRAIWAYEYDPFSTILKLCILTGQRRTEIGSIRPEWMSSDFLVFPSTVTKNKREHAFPVTPHVYRLLNTVLPKLPFKGWSNAKKRIDRFVEIPHWTLHDLRRTFATTHAEIGTPIHIVERLLNHVSGTISGVAAIYNRHSYLPEMRQALENYERHLSGAFSLGA